MNTNKAASHTTTIVAILLLTFLGGCGNIQEKNNNDLNTIYNDPTVIGTMLYSGTTNYARMASCDCALGQLVADSMNYYGIQSDFAFVNAGSVRFNPTLGVANDLIKAGPVTKGDIDQLLPYDNLTGRSPATNPATIVMVTLSGKLLKEVMENSFSRMHSDGTAGTSFGRFLQPSWTLKVWADATKPVGSRVTRMARTTLVNNHLVVEGDIDMTDTTLKYRVAVPSKYVSGTLDGYPPILTQGKDIVDTKLHIYDSTVELLTKISPLNYGDAVDCGNSNNRLVITHQ